MDNITNFNLLINNDYYKIYHKKHFYIIYILKHNWNDIIFNQFTDIIDKVFIQKMKFGVIFNFLYLDKMLPINIIIKYIVFIVSYIPLIKKYLIGTCIVSNNLIGKLIVDTIISINKPIKPVKIVKKTEEGLNFLFELDKNNILNIITDVNYTQKNS